jgi:hypothetical protein
MLYATLAPRLHWRKDLSANCVGAVPCDLGANNDDAKLRVYFLKAFRQGAHLRESFKKGLKTKKTG